MIALTCRECGWNVVDDDETAAMVRAAGHRRDTGHADFTRSKLDDEPASNGQSATGDRPPES
jgi:hypothetical protein